MIHNENLQICHLLKPTIDGKNLQNLLNMKPGPWMGTINDEQIKWQLDHPNGDKDQLIKHIQNILPNHI